MALLEVEGLEAAYGQSQVLFGISFAIERSEVVGLLGRNGAGKTTTLSSIMGLVAPRGGRVRFAGREIRGLEPFQVSRLGLGFVAENCRLFKGLTVAENLETARRPPRGPVEGWDTGRVVALFPQIGPLLRRRAGGLSGGEQRMVAIARTLMGNPSLLLLDEPSEGLAPLVVQTLLRQLQALKQTGATVLLSEQNLHFATQLADRLYVIEKGEIRYHGTPHALAQDPEVRQKYLMV
jgi:branched-chain amino acid transport system ATP-binding protein